MRIYNLDSDKKVDRVILYLTHEEAQEMKDSLELLINNNAVANLIREKRTYEIDVVIETGMESGMIDLNHSLIELVRAGEISIENAYQYSLNPKGLERML